MRKKIAVQHELCAFSLIILRLVRCKFLSDIHDTLFDGGAFAFFEVLHHVGEDIFRKGYRGYDIFIGLEAKRTHKVCEPQVTGDAREGDVEEILFILLDNDESAVAAELGEHFGYMDLLVVSLGELGHDLVARKIFEGH